jgi:putative SOS response-associated peptidase YedK
VCGRFTYRLTWSEIVRLYRLPLDLPARNTQARYNICPTTTIDAVIERVPGERELIPMRWGLVPSWWSKPLKEMRLATFNARAESFSEKPMFRGAFKRTRCLISASGYYEWHDAGRQAALLLRPRGRRRGNDRRAVGRVEGRGDRRDHQVLHDDHHRGQRVRRRGARPDARDP